METMGVGLTGSYIKMVFAVLVGAALGLGVYFLAFSNQAALGASGPSVTTPDQLCICPSCGMAVPKPKGLDCEEINCPNCGNPMNNGAALAAAQGGAALTPNRRETLAEQGILPRGPISQNQRETLAEQGVTFPGRAPTAPVQQATPRPAAVDLVPNIDREAKCICPHCGMMIDHPPGMACSNLRCPNCQTPMLNAIGVGGRHDPMQDLALAGMAGTGAYQGSGGGLGRGAQQGGGGVGTGVCPQTVAAPCPGAGGGGGAAPCPGAQAAPPCQNQGGVGSTAGTVDQQITYNNTISGIISKNCLRCHGGPIRNLTTYDRVKAYADNGLLTMMVQPGGPMSRFLTAHESHQITSWIKNGAPQ